MTSDTIQDGSHNIAIVRGTVDSVPAVLEILDSTVKWLASRGRSGQWGETPFSKNPARADQLREFATTGSGLWLAVSFTDDKPLADQDGLSNKNPETINGEASGVIVGAIALGDKMPYVTPVSEPELYVRLLVTDRKWAGKKIGERLLQHARVLANEAGVSLLRVDCYAGNDSKLVQYYESQGFERSERLNLKDNWPCQVLSQRLDGVEGGRH
ncbi:unnamed protein product [Penicillium salamii]|uniref:N-acetyltransferase domain-containing protein n=1 Tax=Penicillium salamii TaxID=1612424 RepID=A0A9W4J4F6_9EURO|nr:unnamed protein product [Penicillium salamii]CAG8189739.1 unnamed protein product [Penicillium salamii]CAG8261154.1 unnamed protein product [Penicillium salamii]CAG8314557.1 unnamed protein product [Penicillium salamii]CAG8370403.1 unnamed protein product [Penicillium salamii]